MPRPPPELLPTNMPPNHGNGFREILTGLCKEFAAERWAAEARHKEILAKLEEHKNANEASAATFLEKQTSTLHADDLHRSRGSSDVTTAAKYLETAKELSKSFDEARSNASKTHHLSPDSKFGFGTKLPSENLFEGKGWTFMMRIARLILNHVWFEGIVAGLIMGNALVMCFELQYDGMQIGFDLHYSGMREDASSRWPGAAEIFAFLDWFFGIIFLLEACLKLLVLRKEYFRVFWNWLDLFCVFAFLFDKTASILSIAVLDSEVLRALRLFRLIRLARLLRALEKLDVLYIMTTAIKGMSMILTWSVILLSIILMTLSLFLSAFLKTAYFDGKLAENLTDADELSKYHTMYAYFGTFTRCIFSMFELTIADFPPMARLLQEEVSEWFSVFCILHKLLIGFAVVGVINGVILQETFKVANTDDMVMVRQKKRDESRMRKKLDILFDSLDLDKSGEIQFKEFMIIAAQPELRLWLESLDIEVDDLLTLFLLCDGNGDGSLTREEILVQIPRLRGAARGIDMMALRKGVPAFTFEQVRDSTTPNSKLRWSTYNPMHPTETEWNVECSEM